MAPEPQSEDPTRTMGVTGSEAANAGERLTSWGSFELREKVGHGGFGEVYRAWDPKLQREVALKLLRPDRATSDGGHELMLREARLTAKVRHPNVVAVHGVDQHEGRVGFWTDFIRGKTLSALLAAQGPFAAREAASIGMDLCRALSAVHAGGLLHRDIKPGNAMREEGGRILLMDFGLTHASPRPGEPTSSGGTLPFMAPELLAGQPASVASDIYALGALLFELVTGKYPVTPLDGAPDMVRAYASGTRLSLFEERSDLPVAFARTVETAIDPNPEKRFSGAGQFMAALSDAVGMTSAALPAPRAGPRGFRWWMAGVAAAALLAGAYTIPAFRGGLTHGIEKVSGAHADYLKAQDLVDRYDQPHNLENSIPLFQKNLAREPKFAPAWAGLGKAYWREYLDTRDVKYIQLAKDACAKALELGESLSGVHVTLGMIYTDAGRNDLATEELEQARTLDETNAEVYAALSDLYRKEGRSKEIEPALQRAIDLDPKNWRWVNLLGIYYMNYSAPARLDDAVVQFQKAIALTPGNTRAYNNLGLAYQRLERFADAQAAIEKAIQFQPTASAFTNLGYVLEMQGDYAGAAGRYRHSLELAPESYIAAGNLASALSWTSGGREESRKAYRTAIDLAEKFRKDRPRDANVLSDLGSYYASLGDAAKALPLLRQAVALDPHRAAVLYRAGEGFEILQHREEAIKLLTQAIQAGFSEDYIRRQPELAKLREDPRFVSLSSKK